MEILPIAQPINSVEPVPCSHHQLEVVVRFQSSLAIIHHTECPKFCYCKFMKRVPYSDAVTILVAILESRGFNPARAKLSAELICEANRDGVLSHGLARFPNLLSAIESGIVIPDAEPVLTWSGGAIERWDGQQGPGNLNAHSSMARAMELADENGIGCVALSNTNHWMRGGNTGWQAVRSGYIGMCWTNTMPNLPPWGSTHPLVGNNPLVIGIPRVDGPVVLDMAMSQFSYGALSSYASSGQTLPVTGGYDTNGHLTDDPAAISESVRPLPIGFWKGSGLAIVLDLMAALLSGGRATYQIAMNSGKETEVSQIFMAFSPPEHPGLADRVVESLKSADEEVFYPGQRTAKTREESDRLGIQVDDELWSRLNEIAGIR